MTDFKLHPLGAPRQADSAPTWGTLLGAAFEQESAFYSPFLAWQKRGYQPDPDFNLGDFVGERRDLVPFQQYLQGAQSEDEALDRMEKVRKEAANRAIFASSGLGPSMVATMLASVASPGVLVPMGSQLRGIRGVAKLAAVTAGSVVVDEAILQAGQVTRTAEESAANIIGSAILGAGLGTAIRMMTPGEAAGVAAAIGRGDERLVKVPVEVPEALRTGSMGAAEVRARPDDPGQLAGFLAPEELGDASILARVHNRIARGVAAGVSPVVRGLTSAVPEVRAWQARLADAELPFRSGGETVVPAGTVERRTAYMERSHLQRGVGIFQDAYARYRLEREDVGFLRRQQAEVLGLRPAGGKLSAVQFGEEIIREMDTPRAQQHPLVKQAADQLRAEVYDPLFKAAKDVGLVPAGLADDELVGATGYINRVYSGAAITANETAFERMVQANYQKKMTEAWQARQKATTERVGQEEADIEDLSRPEEEVAEIQREIALTRAEFAESETADIRRTILDLRAELRDLDRVAVEGTNQQRAFSITPRRERLQRDIAQAEGLLDERARAEIAQDNALRRRSQVLSGAVARLETRQARVMDQLDNLDDAGVRAVQGLAKRAKKFFDEMDGLSDEAYVAGVRQLEEDFNVATARLDKLEERIHKLNAKHPEIEAGPTTLAMRVQRFRREVLPAGKLVLENEADRADALRRVDEVLANGRTLEGRELTPQQVKSLEELRADMAGVKLNDAADIEAVFQKAWRLEEERYATVEKMHKTAELLEDASREGPEFARKTLQEWFDDMTLDVRDRVGRQERRRMKLEERAAKVDPARGKKRISDLEANIIRRKEKLSDWVRERGGEMGDDGAPDFSQGGSEFAKEIRQKIVGDPTRLLGIDVMTGKRGPELARVLDIPLDDLFPYLETDLDKLIHIYVRNMAPDIELKRAGFGLRGEQALKDIQKAYDRRVRAVDTATPPKGTKDEDKWREERRTKLRKQMSSDLEDLIGQIERLRHQRTIPDNPDSYLYRAARSIKALNTATMMGNVMLMSVADVAVAVARYGFTDVFGYALKPMLTGMKQWKMTAREAKYYGMNEIVSQDRFYQMADLLDDAVGQRSLPERAIDVVANKIGVVGLFSFWNQGAKMALTPVATGRLLDAIEVHITGKGAMSTAKANDVLLQMHINSELAQRIWAQQDNGGLVKENGLWIPNTQSWTDAEARDAFRTGVLAEMDVSINTPGVERPLFVDKNIAFQLVTQFQSFMWSTHVKVLLAGVQQPDFKVMSAVLASTGLGAMSFYVDMIARGRTQEVEDMGPGDWADALLYRSPLLGALAGVGRIAETNPNLAPLVSFGDSAIPRRPRGQDTLMALLGPSASTVSNIAQLSGDFTDPTQNTANIAKRLTPYNNVFYMRQLFQSIAESSGLPEQREAR